MQDILSREEINEVDIGRIEKEINDTNEINSRLIEEKMKSRYCLEVNNKYVYECHSILAILGTQTWLSSANKLLLFPQKKKGR